MNQTVLCESGEIGETTSMAILRVRRCSPASFTISPPTTVSHLITPAMDSIIKEAVCTSRKGASCMATGDYTASIASFRQALQSVTSLVNHGGEQARMLQSWRLTSMPLITAQGSSSDSSCAVFGHCFLIMPLPCQERVPTNDKCALLSAALLFNIALAYHLHASSQIHNQLNHLDRAMSLYQKSSWILQGRDETSDGAVLMLAISNNMASLALENIHLSAFRTYRETMGYHLSLTGTTGPFYSHFFAGNYAATGLAHERCAAVA